MHVLLAIVFVLAGSVSLADTGDWGLELPSGLVVCVKEPPARTHLSAEDLCYRARASVEAGRFLGIPAGTTGRCAPHPECFTARENCIVGYNGPRDEGYCR